MHFNFYMDKLVPSYTSAKLIVILNECTRNTKTEGTWQDLDCICQALSTIQKTKQLGIFSGIGKEVTLEHIRLELNELRDHSYIDLNYDSKPPRARLTALGYIRANQFSVPTFIPDLLELYKSKKTS